MRSRHEIAEVLELFGEDLSDYEIARRTGVPRATVHRWRCGAPPERTPGSRCPSCGQEPHDLTALPAAHYAYLLGQYLGDGTMFRTGGSIALRISCDARYVQVIEECRTVLAVFPGRPPSVRRHPFRRMVDITSVWKAWPCLLPQHGPGRKHLRKIALTDWQVELVKAAPGQFVRGLVHSDGWRGLNRVRVKGRDYEYPRYQFSNRSDDIRALFCWGCDLLGVAWRPWGRWHVSVARRDAVAQLDRFVGPKC